MLKFPKILGFYAAGQVIMWLKNLYITNTNQYQCPLKFMGICQVFKIFTFVTQILTVHQFFLMIRSLLCSFIDTAGGVGGRNFPSGQICKFVILLYTSDNVFSFRLDVLNISNISIELFIHLKIFTILFVLLSEDIRQLQISRFVLLQLKSYNQLSNRSEWAFLCCLQYLFCLIIELLILLFNISWQCVFNTFF